ncbi:Vacuolar protein sorting-associated protein 33A, partial [Coelomomyces lativittatus]
ERHNANTINDIYQFVERLPEIQKKQEHLPIHLSLAESLSEKMDETFYKYLDSQKKLLLNQQLDWDFLQELISRFYPLHFVLSLICLSSELGALTEKQLQILKTDLIQTYGISCMTLWSHLSQLGLLHGPRKYSLYSSLRKSWQLHTESPAPYDVSSVYDGYVPMSVRIVQYILTNQQNLIEKHGNGPSVSHKGPLTSSVYVCFIGGVTFSEVTCLRALAKTIPRLNQLIILTTEILNPQKLFGIDREEKLVVGL